MPIGSAQKQVAAATTPTSASKSRKASRPSLIVHLKLPADQLVHFRDTSPSTDSTDKKKPSKSSTSKQSSAGPTKSESDDASGSVPGLDEDEKNTENDETKPKTGGKRKSTAGEEGEDGLKQKPVQRKRPKVGENGRMDGRTAAAKAMGYNPAAHKLGPKSNQGIINEKLRALDRSRKPCRKWTKAGFKIKSFTGRTWSLSSWNTPQPRNFGEEAESQDMSSNDISKANSSSIIGSDQSPGGDNAPPSSPPIRIAPAPAKA